MGMGRWQRYWFLAARMKSGPFCGCPHYLQTDGCSWTAVETSTQDTLLSGLHELMETVTSGHCGGRLRRGCAWRGLPWPGTEKFCGRRASRMW